MHQVDTNDLQFIKERGINPVGWIPCPRGGDGKINPQVTKFVSGEGKYISVFHVKPIYYEHVSSTDENLVFRPMYEVCEHYGNRRVVFKYDTLNQVHPRYIDWLKKRMELINGEVLISSPFSRTLSNFGFVQSIVHRAVTKPTVGLTTTTVYPDPNPETTTVDGWLYGNQTAGTWSDLVTGAGSGVDDAGTLLRGYYFWRNSGVWKQLGRSIILFDTSAIGTDNVDSAIYSMWLLDKTDTAGNSPDIDIYGSTPASNIGLVSSDYTQCGSTSYTGVAIVYTSLNVGSYTDWTFNATGISNVVNGVTKLSCRNANYDVANVEPKTIDNDTYCRPYSADQSGTTTDPKLVVTHTASGGGTPASNALAFGGGI